MPAPSEEIAKDALLVVAPKNKDGQPTLGGIALTKKLGQGGMGAVYKGVHPRLGVEVAVKVLPFHLAGANPTTIQYFEREARVAAKLNHPNLVRIFDVNTEKDPNTGTQVYFLVMEFVAGPTAGGLLRKRSKDKAGVMAESDALDVVLGATSGLAAAHEENIVHRDIKPDNIIIPLSDKGEPMLKKAKLMDLGLAKSVDDSASMGLTAQNVAMGTPGYMAPEQAEDAKTAGPPADVFSMGATLYALLCGAPPFAGTTIMQILRKTQGEPHPPIKSINPNVSDATAVLIDRCLDKEPGNRFKDAHTLLEALRIVRDALKGQVPTEKTLMSINALAAANSSEPTAKTVIATNKGTKAAPPPQTAVKSSPLLLILGLVAMLFVVGGVGLWYFVLRAKPVIVDPTDKEIAGLLADALAHESKHDWDKAIGCYEGVLAKKAAHEEAKKGLDRAREQKSKAAQYDASLKAANEAIVNQNWPEAERNFLAAQKLNDTEEVRKGLAKALDELKKVTGAIGDAMKRASEAMGKRDWTGAEKAYNDMLKIDASSSVAKKGLDNVATAKGIEQQARDKIEEAKKSATPDDAWALLRKAIDYDPDFAEARLAAAQFALTAKQPEWYDEAIGDCKRVQETGTNDQKVKANSLIKDLESEKKNVAKEAGAIKRIVEAIGLDDWDAASQAVADAKRAHPRFKALTFEQQIEKGRKWQGEFDAGKAAEGRKDIGGAIAAYSRAEKIMSRPKSREALKRLEGERESAFTAAIERAKKAGQANEAAAFDQAVGEAKSINPDRPEIADLERQFSHVAALSAAQAAYERKDYPTALSKAEEVLTRDSSNAAAKTIRTNAKYHLAIEAARRALADGKVEEAERAVADARALNPSGAELGELDKQLAATGSSFKETAASGDGPTEEMVLSRDGSKILAAGGGYESVVVWNENLGSVVGSGRSGGQRVFSIFAGPNNTAWGLYGTPDRASDVYDIVSTDCQSGKRTTLETVVSGMKIPIRATALAMTPDGQNLIRTRRSSNGADNTDSFTLDVITSTSGNNVKDIGSFKQQGHKFLRPSPDRSQFVSGGGSYCNYKGGKVSETVIDTAVYFFSWPDLGQKVVHLGDDFGEITCIEFSTDGKRLLVGSGKGKGVVVDCATYKITVRVDVGTGAVTAGCPSDGKLVAAVVGGKVVIVDQGKVSEAGSTLPRANTVLFSKDGKSLYLGGDDGRIHRFAVK
jgi:serine/threonine protein kinase